MKILVHRLSIIVLIVWMMMERTICASTPPLSYYDYSPRFIEGGKVTFTKGVSTDNDPGPTFNSNFTVPLQRIQNLIPTSNYMIAIGFKVLDITINTSPGYINYWVVVIAQTQTSFALLAFCTDEAFLTTYQMSYVVISKLFGNIYYYSLLPIVNQVPTWPTAFDFNFTDSNIQPAPLGDGYTPFISIYHFNFASEPPFVQILMVTIFEAAPTIWTVRVQANGLYLYSFGVQGFLIRNSLVNNFQLKNILIFTYYADITIPGYLSTTIFSSPGISLTPSNSFFGLHFFYSVNYQVTYTILSTGTQYSEFILNKIDSNPSYMGIYMLAFLRNQCPDPYTYDETTFQCKLCMFYCVSCDGPQCLECAENFTLAGDSLSCLCTQQLVSGICYAFDQSKMKGCVSAATNSSTPNNITCLMCSITQNLILSENECICKQGYEFDSNLNCIEICGDGKLFYLACDDGNLINGDGCSDKCTIEMGFVCTLQSPSKCRYQMEVDYGLVSIMKNKNNSALITIKPKRNLKFPISYNQMTDDNGQTLNMSVDVNGSETWLSSSLMSISNNEITLLVEYDFTIECFPAQIDLNLTGTIYTPESSQLTFNSCGDNEPLVISKYSEIFLKTEYVYLAVGVLVLLLLGVGLCTPKYIGIEAILTLQLIFYSCLLITDVDKIPVGFHTFVSFKYSNSFNNFFGYTRVLIDQDFSKKVVWLTLSKTIVENYNLSFIVLVVASILFVISLMYRSRAEVNYEGRSQKNTTEQIQCLHKNLNLSLMINKSAFNFMSHIVIWSILQIIASISMEIMISNTEVELVSAGMFLNFRGFIGTASILLVGMIGANKFKNVLLSQLTWGQSYNFPHQLQYKQANFIYLITIGLMIFLLNETVIFSIIPASLIILILHAAYVILLKQIDPYRQSLNIHTYGLFFCQLVYLTFLIVINIINFAGIKNQIISLAIVYFFLAACFIIIIFTVVRLYYEYRYGSQLQKKIQKERQLEKQNQLKKDESELKRKMKSFESKFKENLNQFQISRLQNKFLIENQLKEDLMDQQITFLNQRPNLSDQKKEAYYFEKFHQKPLDWLRKNNLEEYQKRIAEMEVKKTEESEKKKRRMQSSEYAALTKRLRKQFFQSSNQIL